MTTLSLHSPSKSHSPVPATLKIHHAALEQVGHILGRLWLVEGDCLTVEHRSYLAKLQKLEAAHKEVSAELRDLDSACCRECAATAAEWDRFEAERPTPEERVRLAEQEAMAEAQTFRYAPAEDEHPVAVGGCDLVIPDRRATA